MPGTLIAILILTGISGCGEGAPEPPQELDAVHDAIRMPKASPSRRGTEVHRPDALTRIASGRRTADGSRSGIGCATCHEMREATHALPASAEELEGPHAGLRFEHGSLECRSCHHPERYDRLRLATGEALPFLDAMKLCSQCHGTQKRDWDHGAHGGMQGAWDERLGSRTRNHCVDCHDPHAPAFPTYQPVFPPRDRFLQPAGGEHG